jgi:hypothetical protein
MPELGSYGSMRGIAREGYVYSTINWTYSLLEEDEQLILICTWRGVQLCLIRIIQ